MTSKTLLGGTLALAVLAPGAVPSLGAEPANAVLHEVTENLKLKPLARNQRVATATLSGTVAAGTSICPDIVAAVYGKAFCVLTATATDRISLVTGRGPVTGRFDVHVQGDNDADGPELVVLSGTLVGTIDLSPALLGPDGKPESGDEVPLGSITGHWSGRGVPGGPLADIRAGGTLTGTFRLPFQVSLPTPLGCHLDGDLTDCTGTQVVALYLQDTGVPVPVAPEEHSLGVPTVKLEITFVDRP